MSDDDVVFSRRPTGQERVIDNAANFGQKVIGTYANLFKKGKTAFANYRQKSKLAKAARIAPPLPTLNQSVFSEVSNPSVGSNAVLSNVSMPSVGSNPSSAVGSNPSTVFSNVSMPSVASKLSDVTSVVSDSSNLSNSSDKPDSIFRRLFRSGNTRNPAPAMAPPQPIPTQTTYKEKYDAFMQKIKNSSGMLYYIIGIIVSFIFIIVGSVLMNKQKSRSGYSDTSTTTVCETGNCYATTDGDGQIILTDADMDPNMNDRSSYMTGMILLLFGIACACLTLILYFRKK
jgi:hypothetical protein